jgi:ADP-heptose:LPS heptosyltransferase
VDDERPRLTMPSRYLFIAPQGIGDSLQVTPLLPGLRAARPDAIIDVLTLRPGSAELFRGLDGLVDTVHHLPFWSKGHTAFVLALLRFVARQRYDASFLAFPAARFEYQLLHAVIRSRRRLAHDYGGPLRLDWVPGFRTRRVRVEARVSNVLRNEGLLRRAVPSAVRADGYRIPREWTEVPIPDELSGAIVVHVGSINHDMFAAKRWPLQNFVEFSRRMLARGERVVYLCGPDERDETHLAVGATPGAEHFEGSLRETTSLLARAALVVTNDSGVGHISVGTGTKTISLFGPTPIEFAPYGSSALPVRPSACPPCFDVLTSDMTCKRNIDYACLRRDLTVDLVEDAAVAALGLKAGSA